MLVGDREQPKLVAVADTLAAGIAGAHTMVISNGGHLVNMEQPAEFNRAVLAFLSSP